VLYAQDRQKVDEIRRGRAFAHIALIVILACVLYTVLGLIINVNMLLSIAADMLKNRHFFIYGHVHECISTAN
jgi:quinol-cytochrome oxidoreductase complex cytochrome b subunit